MKGGCKPNCMSREIAERVCAAEHRPWCPSREGVGERTRDSGGGASSAKGWPCPSATIAPPKRARDSIGRETFHDGDGPRGGSLARRRSVRSRMRTSQRFTRARTQTGAVTPTANASTHQETPRAMRVRTSRRAIAQGRRLGQGSFGPPGVVSSARPATLHLSRSRSRARLRTLFASTEAGRHTLAACPCVDNAETVLLVDRNVRCLESGRMRVRALRWAARREPGWSTGTSRFGSSGNRPGRMHPVGQAGQPRRCA
jgi:hypothetical protein